MLEATTQIKNDIRSMRQESRQQKDLRVTKRILLIKCDYAYVIKDRKSDGHWDTLSDFYN